MNTKPESKRLLRLPEVLKRYPVSETVWYRGVAAGVYPKPVKLSGRCVAWREEDIDRLVESAAEVSK